MGVTDFDEAHFTVALEDQVSEPAKQASSGLENLLKHVKDLSKLKAVETARDTLGSFADSILEVGKSGAETLVRLGMRAAEYVTRGVVSMAIFADSSRRAFASLTHGADGGAEAMKAASRIADELGQDVVQVADQLKGMLAMQFKLPEAEELMKISADLVAVTGHAEAAGRAITAITQIKAKGKLQAEELVGQLAEAGVSTTLVYGQLSKALGKTEAEVRKMLSAGQITADVGIAAIKSAIMEKVHESKAGQAGKAFASETISGLLGQLQSLPNKIFLKAADSMDSQFDKVKDSLRTIIEYVQGIDTGKIAEFVTKVLDAAQKLVPLALEFASGFGEGFSEILTGMTGLEEGMTVADKMEKAREAGRDLAKFFGMVLDGAQKLLAIAEWFTTSPLGQFTGGFLLVIAGITKIVLWVAALKTAFVTLGLSWGSVWGGITAGFTWLMGALASVGSFIGSVLGAILSIPGAIVIVTAAIIAACWIWREELEKFWLWVWDTVTGWLTKIWDWIMNLGSKFAGLFMPDELTARTNERGLGGGAPMQAPELTDNVKGAVTHNQNIRANVTVNVEGTEAAKDPKAAGQAAGEGFLDAWGEHFAASNP